MGLPEYEMGGHLGLGELRSLAESEGISARRSPTAAAIAKAESGGNPRAYNGRGMDRSYGLWQINMIGALGPARRRRFGIRSNDELFDPRINARAMRIISSKGRYWGPWTTYTSGAYRHYLKEAEGAEGEFIRGDVIPVPPSGVCPEGYAGPYTQRDGSRGCFKLGAIIGGPLPPGRELESITGWVEGVVALARFLVNPQTWIRAGEAIGGGVLILVGTYFIIRDVRPSEGGR